MTFLLCFICSLLFSRLWCSVWLAIPALTWQERRLGSSSPSNPREAALANGAWLCSITCCFPSFSFRVQVPLMIHDRRKVQRRRWLYSSVQQQPRNSTKPKLLSVGRLKLGDNRHFWVLYVLQFLIKSPYSACCCSLYGLDEQNEIIEGFKSNYKLSYPNF